VNGGKGNCEPDILLVDEVLAVGDKYLSKEGQKILRR